MEDDHRELVVKSTEGNYLVPHKFRSPTKEFVETKATYECSIAIDEASSEDNSGNVRNLQTSDQRKCFYNNEELSPPHQSSYTSTTSYEDRTSSSPIAANGTVNNLVNTTDGMMDKDMSQIGTDVTQSSILCPDGPVIRNHVTEVDAVHNSDSGSSSVVSDSQSTFYSVREDSLVEEIPSDEDVRHDLSISSNILSSGTSDITARESRQNSRRLIWDTFSRHSSRRHSDSRTFALSTDNADEFGSHERWLLDFGSDFLEDEVRDDSTYLVSSHGMNEWQQHSRSEIWGRLRGGLDGIDRRTNICSSGLHTDGTCSCESVLMAEDSGPHASISRIVMLAEALFEVLDEIHRQPVPVSLSTVSLPAPESVVDTLLVKTHKNTHKRGIDAERCYICLSEYEEGDKIRVLPCHHEYHMSCVDKWLKEMHGVCPVCRRDVRESCI